jgi:2-phosphosulfolactate phosphatase
MPLEQSRYQVRFDWGVEGADAIAADADVTVWVDALQDDGAFDIGRMPAGGAIIAADFRSARAAALWAVKRQADVGRRIVIAVVAAGTRRPTGRFRFAVEDQLAAGAVIAALGKLGLDATSPEAAAAEAAFLGLSRAVSHLVSASVSANATDRTARSVVTRVDQDLSASEVLVLRPGD